MRREGGAHLSRMTERGKDRYADKIVREKENKETEREHIKIVTPGTENSVVVVVFCFYFFIFFFN